jgi:phospholipid/cholesterol/gamma-HCH transport system substrate-binding protein
MITKTAKNTRLVWIGILAFCSFILFFYGIKYLQDETFQKSTISFKVVFKNSQGIDSGDGVRMLGKKIGYIRGTNLIGQNVILDVSVSNIFKSSIPIDSRFEITSEDIMGGKYLTIYPGKDTSKFIRNGDTISGKNSEVVSLTQDIGDFARKLNDAFGLEQKNQIIEAVASINQFTKDLENFISMNQDVITEKDKHNLHLVLSNLNVVSDEMKLIIEEQSDNISIAIENISDFTIDLPNITHKINLLSSNIEKIVTDVNSGKGTLSKLLKDETLYNNINTFVSNANEFVLDAKSFTGDIQKNPKKYIKAYFAAKREDSKNK